MTPADVLEQYAATAPTGPPGECWPYLGGHSNGKGYRILKGRDRRTYSAHRVAYELAHGPIPAGALVDHDCHNADPTCTAGQSCPHRVCCNPAHLRLATQRENTLAGKTRAAANAAKTKCDNGHALSGPNLFIDRKGYRQCRACKVERQRRSARAIRARNIELHGRSRGPRRE